MSDIWIFLDESGTHEAADRLLVGAIVAANRETVESAVIEAFEDISSQSANWIASSEIDDFIGRGFHFNEDNYSVRNEFLRRLSAMNIRIHVAYSTSGPGGAWNSRAASMYYALARDLFRRYRDYDLHFVFEQEDGMNRLYQGIIRLAAESVGHSGNDDGHDSLSWDVTVATKDDPALGIVDYVLAAVTSRLSAATNADFKARFVHAFAGHVAHVLDYDNALHFSSRASSLAHAGTGAHDGRARVAPGSQMSHHEPMTPQSPSTIARTPSAEQFRLENIAQDIPVPEPTHVTFRLLPSFIGCSMEELDNLLASIASDQSYSSVSIFMKGRQRAIEIPNAALAAVQRRIFGRLSGLELDLPACVHGYVKGRSHISNAAVHAGNRYLQKFDIEDFFPSITRQSVIGVLSEIGFAQPTAEALSQLLTYHNRLPLGACTSPLVSNLCLRPLDDALQDLAAERGLVYTRYSDDMAFSGNVAFDVRNEVVAYVSSAGFRINPQKTITAKYGQAQYVTGLSISDSLGPRLPRWFKRQLRQDLYYLDKFGSESFQAGRGGEILGRLQYARGIELTFVKNLAKNSSIAFGYINRHGNSPRDIEEFENVLMQRLYALRSTPEYYRGTRRYSDTFQR